MNSESPAKFAARVSEEWRRPPLDPDALASAARLVADAAETWRRESREDAA